jgi:hypothetical protein
MAAHPEWALSVQRKIAKIRKISSVDAAKAKNHCRVVGGPPMNFDRQLLAGVLVLGAGLSACQTVDLNAASDALSIASSTLQLASAVSSDDPEGAADAAAAANAVTKTPPLRAAPKTGRVPQPTGTSQRGAFEDCEKTYRAAGRADLAAKCATRANNMNSLR